MQMHSKSINLSPGRYITVLLLLLLSGRGTACYGEKMQGELSRTKNFVCYYGSGNEDLLSQFDIVILEPENYSETDIGKIKTRGARVFGYLSLGEDSELRRTKGDSGKNYSGYYMDADKDGMPDKNGNWGSYYVNAGNPEWVEFVSNKAREILMKGCNGLFLDTLDTVDLYPSTRNGMVKLIKHLDSKFSSAFIIANRGITILDEIAPVIDGEMIESFTSTYDWDTKSYRKLNNEEIRWVNRLAEKIVHSQKDTGFIVLILDYTQKNDFETMGYCRERAEQFGFLCSFSDINLSQIYQTRKRVQ